MHAQMKVYAICNVSTVEIDFSLKTFFCLFFEFSFFLAMYDMNVLLLQYI